MSGVPLGFAACCNDLSGSTLAWAPAAGVESVATLALIAGVIPNSAMQNHDEPEAHCPRGNCASFACYPRIWDRGDSYSGIQELAAAQWGGEKDYGG